MYNLLGQRGSGGLVKKELPKFTFWKEAGGSKCHMQNETEALTEHGTRTGEGGMEGLTST